MYLNQQASSIMIDTVGLQLHSYVGLYLILDSTPLSLQEWLGLTNHNILHTSTETHFQVSMKIDI